MNPASVIHYRGVSSWWKYIIIRKDDKCECEYEYVGIRNLLISVTREEWPLFDLFRREMRKIVEYAYRNLRKRRAYNRFRNRAKKKKPRSGARTGRSIF